MDPSSDGTHHPNHTLHHLCLVPIYCALCALFPFCTSYLCSIPYPALLHILPWQHSLLCSCAHPTYICRIPLSPVVYMMAYPTLAVFLSPYSALYSHPILAVFPSMPLCASYLYMPYQLSAIVYMMAYSTLAVFLTLPFVHILPWQYSLPCPMRILPMPCYLPCPCAYTVLLLTTHSVRYHSLFSTISLRLQACYSLLHQPGHATWRVGSKVYVCVGQWS